MYLPTRVKVCGITRAEDAKLASDLGAMWLGFIFHPKSPRALTDEAMAALRPQLPVGPERILVDVAPDPDQLHRRMEQFDFDGCQIHCELDTPVKTLSHWRAAAAYEHLWLAPRLPPGAAIPHHFIEYADAIVLDAYSKDQYGGTGRTGDWATFRTLAQANPHMFWFLAGGLSPDNIAEALAASQAQFVDVNSGVESAPGIKDHAKLRAFFAALPAPKDEGHLPH